jgi:hypothetical protein
MIEQHSINPANIKLINLGKSKTCPGGYDDVWIGIGFWHSKSEILANFFKINLQHCQHYR